MSELGPSARALLDAARGAGPDAQAIARMRSKIDLAIAGTAGGVATKVGTTTASSKAIATTSLIGTAGKLGLLAVVIAAGAGLLIAQRHGAVTEELPALGPSDPPAASLHTTREPASTQPASTVTQRPASSRAPATKASPSASSRAATGVVQTAPITLAREVELVDRAMLALRSGDLAAALTAARLHARETRQRGQLAEDATAIEIEALCTLRDPAAAQRLAAFDVAWPASAQRARLTKVCR